MAKITQISNGDSGLTARNAINEALKSVDVGNSLSGDGTSSDPLEVAFENTDETVKNSTNDTTAGYLSEKIEVGDELTAETQNVGADETLKLTLNGIFYNSARTYKGTFDLENLTADRTLTIQDKSGIIALKSDLNSSVTDESFTDVEYADSPITLEASERYSFDTTDGAITASLPASPNEGDFIYLYFLQVDDTNTVTIDAGTYTIEDSTTLAAGAAYMGNYYIAIWDGTSNWDLKLLTNTDSTSSITSIAESSADAIRNITTYTAGADIINYDNKYLYEYDATSTGTDDGTDTSAYLRPINILSSEAGRWVYRTTLGANFTIDDALSETSTNPVENSVIYAALALKADIYATGSEDNIMVFDADANIKDSAIAISDVLTSQYYDFAIALSDETNDLTTDNDADFYVLRDCTLTELVAVVNTAPAGSSIIIDVQLNSSSIATLTITDGSTTASTTTISTTALTAGDILTYDLTQVGATTAGAGLKIYNKATI